MSFQLGDAGGDVHLFDIGVFDLDGNLLELRSVASEAVALRRFDQPGMHRFQIDFDESRSARYSPDDLTFGPVTFPTAVVPLPAPLALLADRIAVPGLATRRHRRD